ncbi:MAG TPA: CHASE3 domain-containing protein [Sphingomicrobium sp.]|nr:CHASE3 domain-containing protein [Sphingomicrobium sp.]
MRIRERPLFRPEYVFWIAILLLACVSALAVGSTYRLLQDYSASTRSEQTVLELTEFLSDLKDVETGARGYAITREPQFLDPYRRATGDLAHRMSALRELASTENELAAQFGSLSQAVRQRVTVADNLIETVSSGAGPRDLVTKTERGKAAMDQVRTQVGSIIAAEQQAELERRTMLQRQAVLASAAIASGVCFSVILLVWLFNRRNAEAGRRREVEQQLRELNAELEQRIHNRTEDLQRARDLLDAVVENLPDMVFVKDVSDRFRYVLVNGAGERLLGHKRSDILGKTDHELLPKDQAEQFLIDSKEAVASGKARVFPERPMTNGDGTRTVESRKVPIANGDGSKPLVLGIVRDVTEQRSLETQVREMQRLESVGQLTGGIAHDFNNLLAVIMGSIELVCEMLPQTSESAEIANEALEATQRGAELVRRLLAFARKQHLEPTSVDLNDRLPGIVPLLQRTIGERIALRVNPAEQLWHARIDATQVDDALVNLAINSRDAMPGGGTLTIETANVVLDDDYAAHHVEVTPGEYVMLAVSDTGTGMPPEVAIRAFEPFFTTKAEGQGTGLGLSQVFGWVKQSGGHIKIYSEVEHGTTIKLYLPRAREKELTEHAQPSEEAHGRGNETILLVEDNPNVRRTAVRQLTDLGYLTVDAHDGQSALEKVRSGLQFDLLLTDVVMPGGMNGYELADEVEKLRPGTKVLFTSGYTELAANELRAVRKGPLISKPYAKRDLGRALRSALENGINE